MITQKAQGRYRHEDMTAAYADFVTRYPQFTDTKILDDLRTEEYGRLDALGHVYLDYTGGGLYAASQLQEHMQLLAGGVFGNPHSSNPTSMAATELDERARDYVLRYFNADPQEYAVIFTQNASGALRLVGEAFPFTEGSHYVLLFDNHNSVNGIREFARRRGATVTYAPVLPPSLRIDEGRLQALLEMASPQVHNLFAYPAQSNFSGVQHPLEWIERAQALGWDVLLDAAAFAPTNRLDLSAWKPDYVSLSFYKMFGYPTGVGALISKKEKLGQLRRPWFAGGTITYASVQAGVHFLEEGEEAFEDGTIDYLNLPAIEIGLKHLEQIGIETIHERVTCLTGWLLDELTALEHSNGAPLVRIYGPTDTHMRGGTIALNFFDPQGELIDYRDIERLANAHKISLRTGCFCNPGAGEAAMGLSKEELERCLREEERMTFEQFILVLGRVVGAVRISVGLATNFADVYRFMEFAASLLDKPSRAITEDLTRGEG